MRVLLVVQCEKGCTTPSSDLLFVCETGKHIVCSTVGVPLNGLVSSKGVGDGEGRLEQNRRVLLLGDYEVNNILADPKRLYCHGKELTDEIMR